MRDMEHYTAVHAAIVAVTQCASIVYAQYGMSYDRDLRSSRIDHLRNTDGSETFCGDLRES